MEKILEPWEEEGVPHPGFSFLPTRSRNSTQLAAFAEGHSPFAAINLQFSRNLTRSVIYSKGRVLNPLCNSSGFWFLPYQIIIPPYNPFTKRRKKVC